MLRTTFLTGIKGWGSNELIQTMFLQIRDIHIEKNGTYLPKIIKQIQFWKDTIKNFLKFANVLTFDIDDLLETFESEGEKPQCFDVILDELKQDGTIVLFNQFQDELSRDIIHVDSSDAEEVEDVTQEDKQSFFVRLGHGMASLAIGSYRWAAKPFTAMFAGKKDKISHESKEQFIFVENLATCANSIFRAFSSMNLSKFDSIILLSEIAHHPILSTHTSAQVSASSLSGSIMKVGQKQRFFFSLSEANANFESERSTSGSSGSFNFDQDNEIAAQIVALQLSKENKAILLEFSDSGEKVVRMLYQPSISPKTTQQSVQGYKTSSDSISSKQKYSNSSEKVSDINLAKIKVFISLREKKAAQLTAQEEQLKAQARAVYDPNNKQAAIDIMKKRKLISDAIKNNNVQLEKIYGIKNQIEQTADSASLLRVLGSASKELDNSAAQLKGGDELLDRVSEQLADLEITNQQLNDSIKSSNINNAEDEEMWNEFVKEQESEKRGGEIRYVSVPTTPIPPIATSSSASSSASKPKQVKDQTNELEFNPA
ncbi:MAG: hypothetical protein EZS28_018660 [Streblomastix strix]|uniref:Uncharacterized protein n=1 Tax=Streblomastix strix TaxID=222440 RepID=A0A5J4VU26_9EUKA|nr:MAG: hypothetical protein EZS28_018660 [Streblomastix strix]